jgi:hypothetical protein
MLGEKKSARYLVSWFVSLVPLCMAMMCVSMSGAEKQKELKPAFHTSDRCLACHNGLTTPSGKDVSIGFDWRSSIMANSARDPYWQASVRREDLDHPQARGEIEDGCADCHMPMSRYESRLQGRLGEVFAHLPFNADPKKNASAEDGVSCSVCHQIGKDKLGTRESFNGGFVVDSPQAEENHPEYGPFVIQPGQAHIMQTSTGGFRPTEAAHIHDSALCATCHTLYTKSLSADGKEIGLFPEQMPFLEWQHSDYPQKSSCQSCHMPQVDEGAPIAAVLGEIRQGVRQHTFVGANFLVLNMLNNYRNDLSVTAMPAELTAEAERTRQFLQSQAARITIRNIDFVSGNLNLEVFVQNLTGHKLPTAFPSRRAWLHVRVRDAEGKTLFESGALNADGSIQGNDNDADSSRFEPHYREITRTDQVQIYEPILKDQAGHVTTGLAAATGYLKDNRLLPAGFAKQTANPDIAVIGDAAEDPGFTDAGDLIRYSIALPDRHSPFHVEVELWYQPIGFRWAHNLSPYSAAETRRFVSYYESMPSSTAIVLASTAADR